jgi:hypothetical protein
MVLHWNTADGVWIHHLATAVVDFSERITVVLAKYHPGLFGGILLLLIGGFYTFWFWPGRHKG